MATQGNPVEVQAAPAPRFLPPEEAAFVVDPQSLGFRTTAELQQAAPWFGQERALAALELAVHVPDGAFHVYVVGLTGSHKEQAIGELLRQLTGHLPVPGDRVLVQNFQNRDRPRAFFLPAGQGKQLRKDMQELVEDLQRLLPETFRQETFEEEKEQLAERFGREGEEIAREMERRAAEKGFLLQPHPQGGILFLPLKPNGEPMSPQDLERLTAEEQEDLRRREREVSRELKAMLRRQQALGRRLAREIKAVERRVAAEVINPLIEEIAQRYESPEVRQYLSEVREHMLDHLDLFREPIRELAQTPVPIPLPLPISPAALAENAFLDYQVNVLVDNSESTGAPVIVEVSPTYKNLFGAVERIVDPFGRLVTNFTRIQGGSLLRAHGGCIVLNVVDVLSEPLVWRALKRCLKSGKLEIEAYDPFALLATTTLKPEPMQLSTRVVLVGPAEFFQLLYFLDDEFHDIFKIRADFGFEADADAARSSFVAEVARIARQEGMLPFRAGAVARLMEYGARLVGDRRKLPSQMSEIAEVMQEATFWARHTGAQEVDSEHVLHTIEQRIFRLNRVEEKIRELVRDGVLLLDVAGTRVGQVNGLAVLNVGGYDFGRPSRVTAAVSMGNQGIINIEREAQLSGKTHDKGVLILTGYLRRTYAQDFPLSLTASICFEQSYSGVDGDSASATELFAILSALSGLPLRQDLAVTGSVNQWGEIQPIGGINEKVEGFFATCKVVGLTGKQGVVMPAQNVQQLVLRQEVTDAIRDGKFFLYPIRTIDEGIEILTGVKAGSIEEPGTVHYLVARRLRALAEGLRSFASPEARRSENPAPTQERSDRSSS